MKVFSFLNPQDPLEVVDVFAEEPKPFAEMAGRKLVVEAFGIKIQVVGKADLIDLKKVAGRDKDLFDISQLLKKRTDG